MPVTPTGRPLAVQPRAPARAQRQQPQQQPVARARVVPAGGARATSVRPRSAAALRAQEPLNTSVAVRAGPSTSRSGAGPPGGRRGGPAPPRGSRQRPIRPARLTAMPVGPQAPPGSPPRPRQVIIPAGAVDEAETTVLDVPPGSPLEQPQRIIIPPGTVHSDETTVVVVPAPRILGSPNYEDAIERAERAERAERERAERERAEHERREAQRRADEERVREAKLSTLAYLGKSNNPEAVKLRQKLLRELDPTYELEHAHMFAPPLSSRISRAEALRAEQELWDAELEDLPDIDEDMSSYRLQMSMNIEHDVPYRGSHNYPGGPPSPPSPPSPPTWSPQGLQQRYELQMEDVGFLNDVDEPELMYEEESLWEPPEPAPPLIPPPPEEEPIISLSPPRYIYQRYAPHDPEDLMWDWEEPPRPVAEPPILPTREPYSAELFRLVRL